ncbi:hypothetical protein ACMFMG_001240 [Clarireedia jacksonii]
MEDTSIRTERRYVGYYRDDAVPVITRDDGVVCMQKCVPKTESREEMEQPEGNMDGMATMYEAIEFQTQVMTPNVSQGEEQPPELDAMSVAIRSDSLPSESTTMWLRRMTEGEGLGSGSDSSDSNCRNAPRTESSPAASASVPNWAEDWPALNESTGSSKNANIGSANQTTHKNVLVQGSSSSAAQNAVNWPTGHSTPNSASKGEPSHANSRGSKNTSMNEVNSDSEREEQANPAGGNAPATMQSGKGKEIEIATPSMQYSPSEQDSIIRRCSTPDDGSSKAAHVATQYMNRQESIDIINNEALHTVGSATLIPAALVPLPPSPSSGGEHAAVPDGHPMNLALPTNYGQTNNPLQDFQQQSNRQEIFGSYLQRSMTPSITHSHSDMENDSRFERSDEDRLGDTPSEILGDMEYTLELLREQDQKRLSITVKLLKQTRKLKRAQMASAIQRS